MEILELLRRHVECDYISDLRYGTDNKSAKTAIKDIDFSGCTLCEISDAISYIYGGDIEFDTIADAELFLNKQQKTPL